MKFCLVTETFPPEVNGVAMTLERLTNGLRKRGYEVSICRPKQCKDDRTRCSNKNKEITFPALPLPGYPGLHFGLPAKRRFIKEWRDSRPDIVHVATEGPLGWSAIRAAKKLGIPVVSSFHTNFHSYGEHYKFNSIKNLMYAWLRYVHNQTLQTFVPSIDVKESLHDNNFENLSIFGRGVDTELFSSQKKDLSLRKKWGIIDNTPIAIYVGRVAKEKNIELSIEAWKAMQKAIPQLKFVIVGDGPDKAKLQKEYPEIIFAGMQRGEDLAKHYASADCFLFASITETFGNVITEAMASGLYVITYEYAAGKQYIQNGINGSLVEFNNETHYLKQAQEVAQNIKNWDSLRKSAEQTAQNISWDTVINTYCDKIKKIHQNQLNNSESKA